MIDGSRSRMEKAAGMNGVGGGVDVAVEVTGVGGKGASRQAAAVDRVEWNARQGSGLDFSGSGGASSRAENGLKRVIIGNAVEHVGVCENCPEVGAQGRIGAVAVGGIR